MDCIKRTCFGECTLFNQSIYSIIIFIFYRDNHAKEEYKQSNIPIVCFRMIILIEAVNIHQKCFPKDNTHTQQDTKLLHYNIKQY